MRWWGRSRTQCPRSSPAVGGGCSEVWRMIRRSVGGGGAAGAEGAVRMTWGGEGRGSLRMDLVTGRRHRQILTNPASVDSTAEARTDARFMTICPAGGRL